MTTSRTSTVSIGTSTATGNADEENYAETSYGSETTVFVGSLPGDGGGLGVGVQADATAIGTDTLAQLEVTASVSDGAYVDSASASVRALAAAQSADGDAYAAATALLEVYGGADLYYGSSRSTTYTVNDETGSTSVSEVSANIHALDFSVGGDAGSGGQTVPDNVSQTQAPQEEPPPYLPPNATAANLISARVSIMTSISTEISRHSTSKPTRSAPTRWLTCPRTRSYSRIRFRLSQQWSSLPLDKEPSSVSGYQHRMGTLGERCSIYLKVCFVTDARRPDGCSNALYKNGTYR